MLKNLGEFLKSIGYCLHIAWKASKGYTLLRLAGNFLLPLTSIIASYFLKLILDLLAPSDARPEAALSQVIFLLLASLAVALSSRFLQRFTQHANLNYQRLSVAALMVFAVIFALALVLFRLKGKGGAD